MIDLHAHWVPPALLAHIEEHADQLAVDVEHGEHGVRVRFDGQPWSPPIHRGFTDADERLELMAAAGITVQALSPLIDLSADRVAVDQAAGYARRANELMAAEVSRAPERLIGVGSVPTLAHPAVREVLEHLRSLPGMRGVQIPAEAVLAADGAGFWAAAEELDVPVIIHPGQSSAGALPLFLGNAVGNPASTTTAAAHLLLDGTLEQHPRLRILLVHGGGFLPYQIGRLDRLHSQYGTRFGARATVAPSQGLGAFFYDTIVHGTAALQFLLGAVGTSRVVIGTDSPFQMGDPSPARTIESLPDLSPADRERITAGNARRFLGMEA